MANWPRLALAVCVLTQAAGAAALIRGPYLQNVQTDRATILWTADEAGSATLRYTDGQNSVTVPASVRAFPPDQTGMAETFFQYEADLAGLKTGADYEYTLLMNGQVLNPGARPQRFKTAGPGPFSFLVVGDSGSGSSEQLQLADRMSAETGIAMVIHTGDLAYEKGTYAQFDDHYFAPYRNLMNHAPFFPTPGNHEYYTNHAAPYLSVHSVPVSGTIAEDRGRYYSFDWGDAHFVSLDSNLLNQPAADRMIAWFEKDIKATTKFWKVVYFHHTPYPSGYHADDPQCALARSRIVPIAERYGVQLVLNGHEHSYQRSLPSTSGTIYINTSGGGAYMQTIGALPTTAVAMSAFHYLRADLDGRRLTIRAIGLGGVELDKISLAPKPAITGVVNGGDFSSRLARGSLITIFGQNLAQAEEASGGPPRPALNGVTVTLGDRAIPLLYVSPGQINAQLPFDVAGAGLITAHAANLSASIPVSIAETAPAIFWIAQGLKGITAEQPAQLGSPILVLATGLGAVNGPAVAGTPAPSPALGTMHAVQAIMDGHTMIPSFAGLAPGMVGLYEVNLSLPQGLAPGKYQLQLLVAGELSNAVDISVDLNTNERVKTVRPMP